MRFMMFMLPNIPQAGQWMPTAEAVAAMTKFNNELTQAGALLALDGLHPQAEGVRVTFGVDGKRNVTDGPFTEAKEMIGGYWIIQAKSKEEAVEWASRCPAEDCAIEIRQVFEMTEFPPDVQRAAAGSGE
ncbi:MAG: YciI family protein [Acidimicrobiia bacterium]